MQNVTIFLARHGQTDWNAERRLQGQADIPLNALGFEQARANGERLASLIGRAEGFDFVSSPLTRTRQTMETLRTAMGLDPRDYAIDPRLKEVHFGDWQGSTFAEIAARTPQPVEARRRDKWNFVPPGKEAESYAILMARIVPVFEAIERPSVVVAHGGIVRSLFHAWGAMTDEEAANMDVPQDRILRITNRVFEWI